VAEVYIKTAVRLNELYRNPLNLAESLYELGLLYKYRKKVDDAKYVLNKSLRQFQKVSAHHNIAVVEKEIVSLE
ncbi:MAG TPA: hypothetical protein VK861_08810, partial [Bacteroidales bacterium]|nr:hypothetical protein [Bacteroidales bacterium]